MAMNVNAHLKTSLRFFTCAVLTSVTLLLALIFVDKLGIYANTASALTLLFFLVFGIMNIGNYRRLLGYYSQL